MAISNVWRCRSQYGGIEPRRDHGESGRHCMETIEIPPVDPENRNGNQWIDAVHSIRNLSNQPRLWYAVYVVYIVIHSLILQYIYKCHSVSFQHSIYYDLPIQYNIHRICGAEPFGRHSPLTFDHHHITILDIFHCGRCSMGSGWNQHYVEYQGTRPTFSSSPEMRMSVNENTLTLHDNIYPLFVSMLFMSD